jgi:hypothetical protein
MSSQWIRMDCASIDTGWTGDLPLRLFGAWVKMLCLVKTAGLKGGLLDTKDLTPGTLRRKGIDPEDWRAMLDAALAAGAVEYLSNGNNASTVIRVAKWNRYQKDATNTARQERYRASQKEDTTDSADVASEEDVTLNNVTDRYAPLRTVMDADNGDVTGRDVTGRDVTTSLSTDVPYDRIEAEWNEVAAEVGLPQINSLSQKRKDKLRLRWKEGLEVGWPVVLEKIRGSPFLQGKKGSWRLRFDWLCENDTNWLKITEGTYDEREDHSRRPGVGVEAGAWQGPQPITPDEDPF